mgnify:CR=1 FL=1
MRRTALDAYIAKKIEIDTMLDINLKAPLHLTRQVLPGMVRNALGSLGALSGMLGQTGGSKTSGLDGLLGNVKNTNDLNTAFSALGMDSGMVGQFAPILLQYLGNQGVAGNLLTSLGSIWGV